MDYSVLTSAFVGSSSNTVFDQLLGSMVRVPVITATIGAVSVGATVYSVSEGSAKPVTRLSLTNTTITPQKVTALCAVTKETARSNDTASVNFIIRQLRLAVGQQTDAAFIAAITSGVSTIPSAKE
jgi:HK97 family phage major capsid protein